MQATWVSRLDLPSGYIPCCPGLLRADDGREYLPQTDWEWPAVAQNLGWDMSAVGGGECRHESTDGTVPCKECGLTAADFISAAYDWLVDNGGATIADCEYFEG